MSVKSLRLVILMLLLIAFTTSTLAQDRAAMEDVFILDRVVIGSGGGHASGADFVLDATAGQTAVGPAIGGTFGLNAGFWAVPPAVYIVFLPLILR